MESIKSFGGIIYEEFIPKIDSEIVTKSDIKKIHNWLKDIFGEKIQYELIYRATTHGDSNSIIFQRCKNIPNLLWIMKDRDNNIFGCFHSIPIKINEKYCIPIKSNDMYSKDLKCFLFSLNKNKKYSPNPKVENILFHNSSHVIEFGCNNNFEFCIGNQFLSINSVYFSDGPIFNHKNELSGNKKALSLLDLEIFKLF